MSSGAGSWVVPVGEELHGTTLKVYLFLLRQGKAMGVRELQRAMGLSSPSVAAYHLAKLERMGLELKDEYGRYYVTKLAGSSMLWQFIPRLMLYATFVTVMLAFYLANMPPLPDEAYVIGMAALIFITIALWYEVGRAIRMLVARSKVRSHERKC